MKARLANRWLGILAIAALVAVAALVGVGQIPPAHAQESNINADCEHRSINPREGDNYAVTISADDGDENAYIAGRWHTVEHPGHRQHSRRGHRLFGLRGSEWRVPGRHRFGDRRVLHD